MSKYDNLYCKLFIDTDIDDLSLVNLVGQISNGSIQNWVIVNKYSEIYVNKNDDFNETLRGKNGDGFLHSRYFLDIEPSLNVEQNEYIAYVARFLEGLWKEGCQAVAACDFEEELPNNGGYQG
ncbi:1,4-dihydroxy-6-naphthoate synthase [Brevibacillus reuszeri]|uniref:1,4-dihydroxy-6-naphthoate synthase n=1 Tax=Brevibacillus reuszeri TaxID=54915 RepID=UPI00366E7C98